MMLAGYYRLTSFNLWIKYNSIEMILNKNIKIALTKNNIDYIKYSEDNFNLHYCGFCGKSNDMFTFLIDVDHDKKELSICGIRYSDEMLSHQNALYYCYNKDKDCPGSKLNRNSFEFIKTTRNISEQKARKFLYKRNPTPFYSINHSSLEEYKQSQKRDKEWYDKKELDWDKKNKTVSYKNSKDGCIARYGEEKANKICKSKAITIESMINRYGKEVGTLRYKKWLNDVAQTRENFKKRFGEDYLYQYLKFVFSHTDGLYSDFEDYNGFVKSCELRIIHSKIPYMIKNSPLHKELVDEWVILGLEYFNKSIDNVIDDIKKKNKKFHSVDAQINSISYLSYTPKGKLLRSNYEIEFYYQLIDIGLKENVDFLIENHYPNSSLKYDFYIKDIDLYVEIAGMMCNESYKEKMILKKEKFNSMIVTPSELNKCIEIIKRKLSNVRK